MSQPALIATPTAPLSVARRVALLHEIRDGGHILGAGASAEARVAWAAKFAEWCELDRLQYIRMRTFETTTQSGERLPTAIALVTLSGITYLEQHESEPMAEVTNVPLPPADQEEAGPEIKRLLVVDDEPAALVITSRMLQVAGYDTIQAPSAREALRLLASGDPRVDLVITDVVMPETDGRALGRLIAERFPGLPVIYMSAYAAEDIFHRGSQGPDLPFIRKPFSPELLVELVQKYLPV